MSRNTSDDVKSATNDFGATDLEELLLGEQGSEVSKRVVEKLLAKARIIRRSMDSGLAPQEYEKAKCAYRGLKAAYDTILRFPVIKDPKK